MANPKGVDWTDIQSGNWNVAKPYTNEKILKWLVLIDEYQTIAKFGVASLENDIFVSDGNLKNSARLQSLKRLIHAISTLINNTKFAVKKNNKEKFSKYYNRLKLIEKYIDKLRIEKKRGNVVTELNINEIMFGKIMFELDEIVDDVNVKLNESDLIFTHVEEFDPKKAKQRLKDKFVSKEQ